MKKIILVAVIFFSCLMICSPSDITMKSSVLTKGGRDFSFFKYANDMLYFLGNIYVLENFKNHIIKYKLENNVLLFDRFIGGPGQGPGDLNHPTEMSISDDTFAISDDYGFSLFKNTGEFVNKFRTFAPTISFVYLKRSFFVVVANPNSRYLMGAFDNLGKKEFDFCEKDLNISYTYNDRLSPFYVDQYFYDGKLLTDGKFVYFISSKFAIIKKFDLQGKLIARVDLSPLLDRRGKQIVEENKKMLSSGIRLIKNQGGSMSVPILGFFKNALLYEGKIYLLGDDARPEGIVVGKDNELIIRQLDAETLKYENNYKLPLPANIYVHSFVAIREKEKVVFILVRDTEEGADFFKCNDQVRTDASIW